MKNKTVGASIPGTLSRRLACDHARPLLSLAALVAGVLGTGPAALAGSCTDPQSNNRFVCTGDFSTGLNANNAGAGGASVVTVEDLTESIEPVAAGVPGLFWSGGALQGGLDLVASGQFEIIQNAATLSPAVSLKRQGSNGGNGSNSNGFDAGSPGGEGSSAFLGGVISLGMPITATGTAQPALDIVTVGGNGGQGGNGAECCNGGAGAVGGSGTGGSSNGQTAIGGSVTVFGSAPVTTTGSSSPAVSISVNGGTGGRGGNAGAGGNGGDGGSGGPAGRVYAGAASGETWSLSTSGSGSPGIEVRGNGGNAYGDGEGTSSGATAQTGHGGRGGDGWIGGAVTLGIWVSVVRPILPTSLGIKTDGGNAPAALLYSTGGFGGTGGQSNEFSTAGTGGNGGAGGTIEALLESSTLQTKQDNSGALVAVSQGNKGGRGGVGGASVGGAGGVGGGGGDVTFTLSGTNTLSTLGADSGGLAAFSVGGPGGQGGTGYLDPSGSGGATANSGNVSITTSSASVITTAGADSFGIIAQSIAGHGGETGTGVGLIGFAAQAGSAGSGGTVMIDNQGGISTGGDGATAISAQSLGGGGGTGGDGFGAFYAQGGSGGQGGTGQAVAVTNAGTLNLDGNNAHGVLAQSIGGVGGSGGSAGAIVALGGKAGTASSGGAVSVVNSGGIQTGQNAAPTADGSNPVCVAGCSNGIFAQSIGGGGGNGGSTGGWFSVGGGAAGGGSGSTVTVQNTGLIETLLTDSSGIVAHSIGGGGGRGGSSVAVGALTSVAVGGSGGTGGNGGAVTVSSTGSSSGVSTAGDHSQAILAQSVGGGGGQGGFAAAGAFGANFPAVSVGLGGSGSNGGSAAAVGVTAGGTVTTKGIDSAAILAQSVGGGGGDAAFALSISGGNAGAVGLALGGSGAAGGVGSGVAATIQSGAKITTAASRSPGVAAQSIGGGGGNGGMAISGTVALNSIGGSVAIGGKGGAGGDAGVVTVNNAATSIVTGAQGSDDSQGIVAQSIGGGGGMGGLSIAGALSVGDSPDAAFSLGGKGSKGGSSAPAGQYSVSITSAGSVETNSDRSEAVLAQSVGGGGGAGGMSISANVASSKSTNLGISIGGSGGAAGSAGSVLVSAAGNLTTSGDQSAGLAAQSIGGGGGRGGASISGTVTGSQSNSLGLALGGDGTAGGSGASVQVKETPTIATTGAQSDGVVAQSVGGSGGMGGFAVSGNLSLSGSNAIGVALGGGGGTGSGAGTVTVDASAGEKIQVSGDGSRGIVAQSIGGGGGSGGMAMTGAFTSATSTKDLSVGLGGAGGTGSAGGAVTVTNGAAITTGSTGDAAAGLTGEHGILAQSIGGGGGSGGLSASADTNRGNRSLTVDVGGGGGSGATSSTVGVTNSAAIQTQGYVSHGIVAQSIAGGGGDGGGTANFGLSSKSSKGFGVSVGGTGGGGASSNAVTVALASGSAITTAGLGSRGVLAQSIAGGGGNGGGNIFKNQSGSNDPDQLSVAVGGSGGVASNAGGVVLRTSAPVSVATGSGNPTSSDAGSTYQSHGVQLQSIGGGGGNGAAGIQGAVKPSSTQAAVDIGVGGKGKGSGSGGSVTAGSAAAALLGSITTGDYNSYGLFAQSIGGGGGNGASGVLGDVTNNAGKGLTIGVGGSGGSGGSGGAVSVASDITINTDGDGSKGLVAQSVGGGGGAGAQGIQGNVSGASDSGTKQITFGLGGSGGGGGSGSTVTLTNSGAITTGQMASGGSSFDQMDAIVAQSIGGGGGIGGLGIAGNIANSSKGTAMSLTLGIGEAGGGAGNGGLVKVGNSAALSVAGNGSRGIVAQSIGGGGGSAGAGIAGNITAPSDASSDYQVDFGLGGKAGGGGAGGQVQVSNSGAIQTAFAPLGEPGDGDQVAGILAQSIGGGGGVGGIGISGDITGSKNSKALNLAIGGAGGSGGSAAQGNGVDSVSDAGVGISNSGAITTVGDGSMGIVAQSIGGGGGKGAVGLDGTVASGDGKSLTVGVGAIGGSGGQGGTVYVVNAGTIQTGTSAISGDSAVSQAHAIFAQSVGGGGGAGMHTGSLVYGSTSATGTEHGIALSVGGTAAGGNGGAVRVDTGSNRSNTITTYNRASHGVLAQSVGGGGGLAGDLGGIGTQEASDQWAAAIAIGGSGSSGAGGAVTINHEAASVTTHGDGALGLLAQSIGGGGGLGGDAAGLQNTGVASQTTKNSKIAINIGANGSQGGNGGAVNITADGAVTTNGIGATAIFGQSVGAGGGVGGVGATGVSGTVTLGGTGTATGDGGAVTITANGAISTAFGPGGPVIASHGILAQSIGGGGGYGGNVQTTYPDFAPVPQNSAAADNAFAQGASGNGADVTVKATGNIRTTGGSSAGILAQSVGGGGGIAGTAGSAFYDDGWLGARIGSAGGSGAGGAVGVTYAPTGNQQIYTSGVAAHGIFAQSAGGAAASTVSATKTSVTVAGPILTTGEGSFGVYAESSGQGAGAIDVTVTSTGSVTGGASGSQNLAGPLTGAGIVIRGGTANNTVNNEGAITTMSGVDGIAITYSGSGKTTVNNSGTITGQILKASSIDVLNRPDGWINSGPLLDVDTFTNQGTLAVAGSGLIGTTRLTGDLVQTGSGVLAVDLDPGAFGGAGAADRLSVGGRATLDGQVAINLLDVWQPNGGMQSVPILTADGGLAYAGVELTRSAVAQYQLQQPTSGALHLGYSIDFANPGILAQTNDNQDNIARYIHGIYRAQALNDNIARDLIAIENSASYAQVMNTLSAEIAVDNQIGSLLSGIRFNDELLSCAERTGDYRFFDQGQCGWLRLRGQHFEQQATNDNLGFDEDSWQLAGGGQLAVGNGWHLGGALSYEWRNLNADDSNASSDGGQFQAGISAKRGFGATELSGSLTIGYGDFDIARNPWPGESIDGTQKLWLYSAQVRAAHLIEYGRWSLKPRLDLGVDYLSMDGFTEAGSSNFRISHQGESNTYFNLQPAIDIQTEFETDDGLLIRPKLTLGITQFIGNAAPSVTGRFSIAPQDVAPFTASTDLDRTRFDVAAGVEVFTSSDLIVRAELFGSFSDNTESYGGGLQVAMPF